MKGTDILIVNKECQQMVHHPGDEEVCVASLARKTNSHEGITTPKQRAIKFWGRGMATAPVLCDMNCTKQHRIGDQRLYLYKLYFSK